MARYETPEYGYPRSLPELRKFHQRGAEFDFMKLDTKDYVHLFEDFLQASATAEIADKFTVAAGATATTWTTSAYAGGMVRGASGTTAATSGLQISTPAIWYGDQYAGCEVRVRNSVITEQRLEIGFADALPSVNTLISSNLSTPTFNTAADVAIYLQDHATATTTSGFYTDGTSITAAKTATTTNRFAADTWYTVRIQLMVNQARLWINGIPMVSHKTPGTDYIEGGTALKFVISSKRSDTTDSNIDIDYIRVWQLRP